MSQGKLGRKPMGQHETAAAAATDVPPDSEPRSGRSRLLPVVITGVYSWALTVLPPLAWQGPSSLSGVAAGAALVSLLGAPFLPRGRWALVAAVDVFVGLCLLSWWAGRHQPVAPPLAIFGSFGWLAYTLALGSLSTPQARDEPADPGPQLDPRTPPRRLAAGLILAVLIACLVLLAAPWTIERPALSVLGHVLALALVLLLLRSGAQLATYVQVAGTRLVRPLHLRPAVFPLLGLVLLGGIGGVYFWLGP